MDDLLLDVGHSLLMSAGDHNLAKEGFNGFTGGKTLKLSSR